MSDDPRPHTAAPRLSPLAARLWADLRRDGRIRPGERVLVAFSGGLDSSVLLHLLWECLPRLSGTLMAAHLNHGLRTEAALDARFAARQCATLGVPLYARRRRVVARPGESPQEAARRVRYGYLHEVATAVGAHRIAVAHHRDDLAETLVMGWLAGVDPGLAPMPVQRGKIVRPLLSYTRQDLADHARAQGIAHVEDASNLDLRYRRNRVRAQLMPILHELNPALTETLPHRAREAAEDGAYLMARAERHARQLMTPLPGTAGGSGISGIDTGWCLDGARLGTLHPALARRVIGIALARCLPYAPGHVHTAMLYDLAAGATGRRMDLPDGWVAEARYGDIWLVSPLSRGGTGTDPRRSAPAPVPLAVPGSTSVPWAGMTVDARLGHVADTPGWTYFDPAAAALPLTVRVRRPGDRFCPSGMVGSRKLKDVWIDAKVPRAERGRLPLIATPDALLWVVGQRQDARFMVQGGRGRALALRARVGARRRASE